MSAPPSTAASRELRRLGLGHEVDDERLAHRPQPASARSASARSLSPRPERQTTTSSASSSSTRASACAGSSAGMMPSVSREALERGERLLVGRRRRSARGPSRGATRARARRPGSRAPPRSSARPRPARPRRRAPTSARRAGLPARPLASEAAPAASTPTSSTSASSRKPGEHADRVRAAADAGDDGLRQPPLGVEDLLARLAADHRLQLAHELRVRRGPDARADQVVRRLDVRRSSRGSPRSSPP